MRVSEYYKLGRTQLTLDFVDVDTVGDTRVFIDPRAKVPDERLEELYGVVKSYVRDESLDEAERARRFKAAADEVFENRKSVIEELAKGSE